MDIGVVIAAIIAGSFAFLNSILGLFRNGSRKNLQIDIDIYNSLPEDSKVRKVLSKHIDQRVNDLINKENKLTRNLPAAMGGLFLTFFAGYGAYYFSEKGSFWLLLAGALAFLSLVGVFGFFQEIKKTNRDEKGKPIK